MKSKKENRKAATTQGERDKVQGLALQMVLTGAKIWQAVQAEKEGLESLAALQEELQRGTGEGKRK